MFVIIHIAIVGYSLYSMVIKLTCQFAFQQYGSLVMYNDKIQDRDT